MVQLGQKLKDARIQRKLTLEEVAVATKIKPQFLEAIERGAYAELPSPAYAQGFVRNYAAFLGLQKVPTSALFKRDFDEKRAVKVLPDGMNRSQNFPLKRLNLRRIMIGGSALLLLIGFLFFQYRFALIAPSISIKTPKEGSVVGRDVEIKGKTDSNATVIINNEAAFVNSKGEFMKKVTLFPGNNTVIIKAKNRMGKESVLQRSVVVK